MTEQELPKFESTSGIPFDVNTDTVDDFVANSNTQLGGGEVGHMQLTISYNFEGLSRLATQVPPQTFIAVPSERKSLELNLVR